MKKWRKEHLRAFSASPVRTWTNPPRRAAVEIFQYGELKGRTNQWSSHVQHVLLNARVSVFSSLCCVLQVLGDMYYFFNVLLSIFIFDMVGKCCVPNCRGNYDKAR